MRVSPTLGCGYQEEEGCGAGAVQLMLRCSGEGRVGGGPSLTSPSFSTDIRLRVRAEYCEHGPALEQGVASRRPQALARQLDVFGQATAVLRSRDLGSVVCDIKFSELSYLDAFWGDYLSGALLQALRGVFLTEALREIGRASCRERVFRPV